MSKAVDDYVDQFSGEAKSRLTELRKLVGGLVPEAEESISYDVIGYKLNKKPLVYFGGFAHHIGFYAVPNTHDAFKADLAKYKQGKGSVQFPLDQPLPIELIKRMVEFRKQTVLK